MKLCFSCEEELPFSDFHRNRHRADGYTDQCRVCRLGQRRQEKYGVSPDQYNSMLEAQGGVCAICRRAETQEYNGSVKRLCVDHDHDTGVVRSLLCAGCNVMIGHAGDDPGILVAAAAYLGWT